MDSSETVREGGRGTEGGVSARLGHLIKSLSVFGCFTTRRLAKQNETFLLCGNSPMRTPWERRGRTNLNISLQLHLNNALSGNNTAILSRARAWHKKKGPHDLNIRITSSVLPVVWSRCSRPSFHSPVGAGGEPGSDSINAEPISSKSEAAAHTM